MGGGEERKKEREKKNRTFAEHFGEMRPFFRSKKPTFRGTSQEGI